MELMEKIKIRILACIGFFMCCFFVILLPFTSLIKPFKEFLSEYKYQILDGFYDYKTMIYGCLLNIKTGMNKSQRLKKYYKSKEGE